MLSFQINHYEYKTREFCCLIIKKTTDTANKYVKTTKLQEEQNTIWYGLTFIWKLN